MESDASRASRRARAKSAFTREGFRGLAMCATAAASAHAFLQYGLKSQPYINTNWRLKLLVGTAAGLAGFAISSERAVLAERDVFLSNFGGSATP